MVLVGRAFQEFGVIVLAVVVVVQRCRIVVGVLEKRCVSV